MIKKDYTTPNTGALASLHVVTQVSIDYSGSNQVTATVSSFFSEDAYAANRVPMYVQQVPLDGLPPDGQNPQAYAEQRLVEPIPDGEVSVYANRRVFSGGAIIAASSPT